MLKNFKRCICTVIIGLLLSMLPLSINEAAAETAENVNENEIPIEFNADSVFFEDLKGNTAALGDGAVSPLISNIKIDFGVEMPEPNEKEGISLSGGGQDIDFTLKKAADSGSVWIMTLGGDFTYTFTTNAGECKAALGELKVNGQKVENLSELTAGGTLKVEAKYTNSTAANKNLVVIVVYFDKDETMLQTNSVSKIAAASTGSTEAAEFTIPDMSKVETVKVFLWDDWSNMNPYCAPVAVQKAAESPSPSV